MLRQVHVADRCQDLVSRLNPATPTVNNGVLQVAHSIFKRWRPLYRSDDLYIEINHVQSKFVAPFLSLLQSTDRAIQTSASDKAALEQHMATMEISIEIIHDLCSQDIPEAIVENLSGVCGLLIKYLTYDSPLLHTDDDAEPGLLERTKSEILEFLTLCVKKYEEDINPYVEQFANTSWSLLTSVGPETKYDALASRALLFLTSVTGVKQHAQGFNNEAILQQVLENVILPNLRLREVDVELFEDEPIEYIRRDLEGTDSETRRRAATDFLRQLMQQFQELVTSMTQTYISAALRAFSSNPAAKWQEKDLAIYLFCSIASAGTITASHGAINLNPHVNIIDFFSNNIADSLTSDSAHPVLQVDAIKYLYIFRSQLSTDHWQQAFPLLTQHLMSDNYVVRTYATVAIERVLYITNANGEPFIPRAQLAPQTGAILQRLFRLVQADVAPEKIQENEFYMRCIMRILIFVREDIQSHVDLALTNLINIANVIRHNPANPQFYYYLFEAIGALIRFAAPAQPQKLENALYGPCSTILTEGVVEFMPYVFQLFAALLEANPSGELTQYDQDLMQPILAQTLWESKGNIPALTRLLVALINRGGRHIAQANMVEPVLGIFQRLISSKQFDVNGYDLLEAVVASLPPSALQPYLQTIFSLLFTRLSSSKTESFAIRFVRLYYFMSAEPQYGTDAVIAICDGVQQNLYVQLYLNEILPGTAKLARPLDRKTAVVALTKTLGDSQAFADKYAKGWAFTCKALLALMTNPPLPAQAEAATILDLDVDDAAFGVGFTPLTTCRRPPPDAFPEVVDSKAWIGGYLKEADARHGGRVAKFVQERLDAESQQALGQYLQG